MTQKLKAFFIMAIILMFGVMCTGITFLCQSIIENTKSASYTLMIDANGGLFKGQADWEATQATGTTFSLPAPEREGYKFMGWIPTYHVSGAKIASLGPLSGKKESDNFFDNSSDLATYGISYSNIKHSLQKEQLLHSPYNTNVLKITASHLSSDTERPGFIGGFAYEVQTDQNDEFVCIINAKIPEGFMLEWATNRIGKEDSWDPADHAWLTPNQGTGEWETYIHYMKCWDIEGGRYQTTDYFYIHDPLKTNKEISYELAFAVEMNVKGTSFNKSTYVANLSKDTTYTFGSGAQKIVALWQRETWTDVESELDTEFTGAGTQESPYLITSANELAGLAKRTNTGEIFEGVYFKQTKSLNVSAYEWEQIGRVSAPFKGNYDGAGYAITNLRINRDATAVGLFGYINGATVKNIILKNSYICAESRIGGIVGWADNKSLVENCDNYAPINVTYSSGSGVGGIVGRLTGQSTVRDCYNGGSITNSLVMIEALDTAGIVGLTQASTIDSCINVGDIRGYQTVGGITSSLNSLPNQKAIMKNCYNSGDIYIAGANAGGLAGRSMGGYFEKCISEAEIRGKWQIGGLIGYFGGDNSIVSGDSAVGYVIDCAAYGVVVCDSDNLYYSGGIVGHAIDIEKIQVTNCSFYGSSNIKELQFIGTITMQDYANIDMWFDSCYSYCNNKKLYSQGDFTEFGVVSNMNDGLPIQKNLFSIADSSSITGSDVITYLQGLGFTLYKDYLE